MIEVFDDSLAASGGGRRVRQRRTGRNGSFLDLTLEEWRRCWRSTSTQSSSPCGPRPGTWSTAVAARSSPSRRLRRSTARRTTRPTAPRRRPLLGLVRALAVGLARQRDPVNALLRDGRVTDIAAPASTRATSSGRRLPPDSRAPMGRSRRDGSGRGFPRRPQRHLPHRRQRCRRRRLHGVLTQWASRCERWRSECDPERGRVSDHAAFEGRRESARLLAALGEEAHRQDAST